MLLSSLASIQDFRHERYSEATEFYESLDIHTGEKLFYDIYSQKRFGIYDYGKKNKLADGTEVVEKNGRAQ